MMNKCELILDATLHLLAHRGFHGFSIRDVAKESGVATGTVYLYFEDREDLIKQLHGQIIDRVARQVFAESTVEVDLFQQFRRMCLNFWSLFLQKPAIVLSKGQFDHLPPDVLRSRHEEARLVLEPLFTFFSRGREQKILKDLPDEILFSLGFEPYFEIARKTMQGIISIDEAMLEEIILASWDSISLQKTSREKTV
ncbi:TetR/AcrR family transcriptional regulator [Cellvibrio sp. pealriver]|uniref:TetR/AcrR family transcriptional regulator n=1 Tax=Cellvibrio sp. pealriver TaxID=1622269 RepID=UPI00066FF4D3|nr:TetR/AcrR family transcriptional regulator [Cellvibrio sp. pealriver]